jgi:surface protein
MFYGCSSLISINLSNFVTNNVKYMDQMFYGCNSLEFIDLSNFNMIICYSSSDLFSDIYRIKYINLYNFKNDRIINSIFSQKGSIFYACQSNKIITNQNALNCCHYNFTTDKCDQEDYATQNSGTNNGVNGYTTSYYGGSKKSSGLSIGIIIGIVAGGVVVISIIIVVICLCKKKKLCKSPNNNDTISANNLVPPNTENNQLFAEEYEYEPKIKNGTPKVYIILMTTSQRKIKILINPDKSMSELIKFYFESIKRPELFGDPSIRFIMNAQLIFSDSKGLIKDYINNKNEINTIVIDDLDDKIDKNDKTIPTLANKLST